MPKHDFHDQARMSTKSNKTHCLCHFGTSNYKSGLNIGFDLTIVNFFEVVKVTF